MSASHVVGLGRLIGLGTEVRGSGPGLGEEAREHWLNEGAEDNLSTAVIMQSVAGTSSRFGFCESTYPVWGRAIHKTRTNLKV